MHILTPSLTMHPAPPILTFPGTHQFPGGHLEHGESFTTCAAREAFEETGLILDESSMRVLATTNDVFEADAKHYITIFVVGSVKEGESVVPVVSFNISHLASVGAEVL